MLLLASAAVVLVGSVLYVGSWRWTAPVVCPAHHPDGLVVESVNEAGVNSPRFSLFCMGETGDYQEVGAWRPMAVLVAAIYGPVVVVTLLWWRRGAGA
jgi:hypothetical protein